MAPRRRQICLRSRLPRPRQRVAARAERCRGTGTTRSAPSSRSAPAARMRAARWAATVGRPSYFNACTIARSDPSYGPIARARERCGGVRRQRGHRSSSTPTRRQDGRGSPQVRQHGGVIGTIDVQHAGQTAPRVGCSSGARQAAQSGASRTAAAPSIAARSQDQLPTSNVQLHKTNEFRRVDYSSATSIRSASPHNLSSE